MKVPDTSKITEDAQKNQDKHELAESHSKATTLIKALVEDIIVDEKRILKRRKEKGDLTREEQSEGRAQATTISAFATMMLFLSAMVEIEETKASKDNAQTHFMISINKLAAIFDMLGKIFRNSDKSEFIEKALITMMDFTSRDAEAYQEQIEEIKQALMELEANE